VRLTDAITKRVGDPLPWFELARRVEGLAGEVRLACTFEPRFPLGGGETVDLEVLAFGDAAGSPEAFTVREGSSALLALIGVESGPRVRPARNEIERRLDETAETWRTWIRDHAYDGPWRDAVARAALVLRLLTYEPLGGMVAAPTTSLPERVGGDANWDYRFCWVRDSAYALDALLALGRREAAHKSFAWLLDQVATTAPEIRPLYALPHGQESAVRLRGYRDSQPVRAGNAAWRQEQLGVYGDLIDTAWRYVDEGNALDVRSRELIVRVLDRLAACWRDEDAGFWESRDVEHCTHSKLSAQIAFDRAIRLA
jgi:GH15 family glucan-1,4-alpha-glucosidase